MTSRRAFTLIEAVVVLAILLTLIGLLWPAISAARANAQRRGDGVEQASREPQESWQLQTVKHDGHWFVTYLRVHAATMVHHPDCPCFRRKAERETQ